jgi:hypothetical protein
VNAGELNLIFEQIRRDKRQGFRTTFKLVYQELRQLVALRLSKNGAF